MQSNHLNGTKSSLGRIKIVIQVFLSKNTHLIQAYQPTTVYASWPQSAYLDNFLAKSSRRLIKLNLLFFQSIFLRKFSLKVPLFSFISNVLKPFSQSPYLKNSLVNHLVPPQESHYESYLPPQKSYYASSWVLATCL